MILFKQLPANPFWNFSLRIYQQPQTKADLLTLQNDHGLNINLLLFCIWYGAVDQGRLARQELKQIILSSQGWHEQVVLPLKRLKTKINHFMAPVWHEISADIAMHEFFAWQIEQLLIMDGFNLKKLPIRNNIQKLTDTLKNIALYCEVLNIFLDPFDCQKLCHLLGTVFSEIDKEGILGYCMELLIKKELKSLTFLTQYQLDI
jgi:uncharacterized protein (TIGR02444 family)